MIQRIQTLYLLLAAICAVVLCIVSPVTFHTPEEATEPAAFEVGFCNLQEITINELGEEVVMYNGRSMSTWGLTALALTIGILAVVDIFLYKKRILQARLNIFTIVACLGYYAMVVMYYFFAKAKFGVTEWRDFWPLAFPLMALVLTLMATRAILKDEALVRAADRIR